MGGTVLALAVSTTCFQALSLKKKPLVLPHYRPGGSKIALVWLTGICGRYVSVTQKLGGCGGMLPQENFLNLMLWDGSWGYFGAQNVTAIHCFSPGMVTKFLFTSPLHCIEVSIHRRFQSPGEPCEREMHASRSEFCLVFSRIIYGEICFEDRFCASEKGGIGRSGRA